MVNKQKKKERVMKKSYTLFTGLVLLAASLVFTGCENFLSGNNLKKELEEKIQYEKKPAYTISVELEKAEYGQCNLNTFELKEGESKALTFTLGSGYNFKYWECNDPEAIEFSPENSAKTTVTLKKGKTDLIITPVCAEVFGVKNILPEKKDGGVPRDSPIILTFTHSIKPESLGTIGDDYKILIAKEDGTDLSEFYGAPVFSENNTVVKFPAIREKPVIENGTSNIEVIVKAGIESEAGETIADKYSYKFKVNSSRDSDVPLFIDFKVTSKKPSFNQTLETLSEEYDSFKDKITIDGETLITEIPDSSNYKVSEQFHIKDKLYIYCKAEDKGSGAYRLVCDSISFPTAESGKKFVLTSENIYEIDDCEIDLSSYPDGEIELTFKLYDYCNNVCPDTKVYKVIKDTKIEQDGVMLFNDIPSSSHNFSTQLVFSPQYCEGDYGKYNYINNKSEIINLIFEKAGFFDECRKIKINEISNDIWMDGITKLSFNNTELYYKCKNEEYKALKMSDYFLLENFDSKDDLLLRLIITDSVGNQTEIKKNYPCGALRLEYSEVSDSFSVQASKDFNNADSVDFKYFYIQNFTDNVKNLYNKKLKDEVSKVNDIIKGHEGEPWIPSEYIEDLNNNAVETLLKKFSIDSDKDYLVSLSDFNYARIHGVGPTGIGLYSSNIILDNYESFSSANDYVPDLRISKSIIDTSKPVTVYAVPYYEYKKDYGTYYIYGLPIEKQIFSSDVTYSNDYSLTFNIASKSSGINTGTCDLSFEDIVIVDSDSKNVTGKFDLEFYYKRDGSTKTSSEINPMKVASVSTETEYIVGIIATGKEDTSIILNTEKKHTLQPIDNVPPNFYLSSYSTTYYESYNLFDSDRTGKMFYIDLQGGKYSNGIWDPSWKYNYLLNDNDKKIRAKDGTYDYEFYWIKDDMVRKEFPALTDEDFPYVLKGSSTFDWKYSEEKVKDYDSKMWVPVYDLDDDNYILVVKMYDENENYTIKPITYNQIDTYKSKPEVNLSGSTLSFQLNVENQVKVDWPNYMSFARKVYFAGISYLDSSTNKWKEINYDNELKKDDDYYSGEYVTKVNGSQDVSVADGKFVKLGIQGFNADSNLDDKYATGRRSNGCYDGLLNLLDPMYAEINSYPVYKYIGSATCNLYNMIEGSAGISIITDGPVLIHTLYSTREEGYGDNIDEWERRAREWNPVQINKNSNYTGYKNLPSDAKSYVVVAYFANGERVISSVYHKE